MRIFITGAGGFLGRNLIDRLLKTECFKIYAISSQKSVLKKRYKDKVLYTTLEDIIDYKLSLNKEDILINCAFPRQSNGEEFAKGLEYVAKLLFIFTQRGVGSVINISSKSVYSQYRTSPAIEDITSVDLQTMYAVGKYSSELFTSILCSNLNYTNVRMASLIGPGFDQRVTNKLIDSALKSKKIIIQTGQEKFGFLDIIDAVDGLFQLILTPSYKWKKIYNLGNNNSYSLLNIAQTIADVFKNELNQDIEIEVIKSDSLLNSSIDSTSFFKDTGYKPITTLQESIRLILMNKLDTVAREGE